MNQTEELLRNYLKQGYTRTQLNQWLKDQNISYFKRDRLLNKTIKIHNAEVKQQEAISKLDKEIKQVEGQIKTRQKAINFDKDTQIILKDVPEANQPYTVNKIKGFFDIKNKKIQTLKKKYPEKSVIARIELRNGMHRQYIVQESKGGFHYKEAFYIFDNESKQYDIDSKMYFYEYHEDYGLPFKKKIQLGEKELKKINVPLNKVIPINEIQETLIGSGLTEIEYASNPNYLSLFLKSRVLEKILMGVDEDELFRFIKIMTIINAVLLVASILISLWNTGLFNQVTGG